MKKFVAVIFLIIMTIVSVFKVEIIYDKTQPEWILWGAERNIHWDEITHVWINTNNRTEMWRWGAEDPELRQRLLEPERVPVAKVCAIQIRDLWQDHNYYLTLIAMTSAAVIPNRRLLLVNAEEPINEFAAGDQQYRVWPHLGLLYVGTVADQEGWEVTLHDELVQGYANLEKLVQPGDVVGISMVVTGIERGMELARQAKHFGASRVIAGNDSAIFRASQIMNLPERPIDAVFTSNSLTPIRNFLRLAQTVPCEQMDIADVVVGPDRINRSNEPAVLQAERQRRLQLRRQGQFDDQDVFVVPRFELYGSDYWEAVWRNYRHVFGIKHADPSQVKNATALFAQGCTRAGYGDTCSYCTIAGVSDIRLPSHEYLVVLLEAHEAFGLNHLYNTTDSALEMRGLVNELTELGAHFSEGLTIYGRAWGLAHHPELAEQWLSLTGGRLMINLGLDSGDERILEQGIGKAVCSGSRLNENRLAVTNAATCGAHLQYSLIFGSPGETKESCERTMEFFEWTRSVLGPQLDEGQASIYWLNHGSPASRVFRDYGYAQQLAALAGKDISPEAWEEFFHRHRDTLAVPRSCQKAWYDCFTDISIDQAWEYSDRVITALADHEGAVSGRTYKPV
ncbi:MAG: hypothetical protein ABIG32_03860 [Candidatus Uhrbacteria bacterium]|nr:hypothetical protein [Patescibacteria group bacterium]MBU1906546.1 hypothetical protein [Patescibacteria group bacterium]